MDGPQSVEENLAESCDSEVRKWKMRGKSSVSRIAANVGV